MKDMLAKAAGYNPCKFAGHSLRQGGATFAYQCDVNPCSFAFRVIGIQTLGC